MRLDVLLLKTGIAIPILYFGSVAVAALFYPGFSFARQFASERGAEGAPHPQLLNVGVIAVAVVTLIATVGYWRVLRRLGARPVPARLTCYVLAMFGVAMVMAGIFPHPDWRHSGAGLGIPILAEPAFLSAAVSGRHDMLLFRRYLIITNVLMVALLGVYLGATHSEIVGLCQFLYTLLAIPWMGVSACVLSRYVPTSPTVPESVSA